MGVIPTSKWASDLDVAKLTPFHIVAVLEFPANAKRTEPHSQHSAITIADAGRRLQHFQRLPGRRQSLERTGLCMPAKNFFRRRVNY
jgi:hypothetical protein